MSKTPAFIQAQLHFKIPGHAYTEQTLDQHRADYFQILLEVIGAITSSLFGGDFWRVSLNIQGLPQVEAALEEGKPPLKMYGMWPAWREAARAGTKEVAASHLRLLPHIRLPER